MTYNDMPVIIPLLATGYLLTIYLLLILAQRTIKSSRYVADSLTDAYASYATSVTAESASQVDDFERWSRSLERSPSARWTNTELNASASSSGVTALRLMSNQRFPFGEGSLRKSRFVNDKGSTQGEPLREMAKANTYDNNDTLPDSSTTMLASAAPGHDAFAIVLNAATPQETRLNP